MPNHKLSETSLSLKGPFGSSAAQDVAPNFSVYIYIYIYDNKIK